MSPKSSPIKSARESSRFPDFIENRPIETNEHYDTIDLSGMAANETINYQKQKSKHIEKIKRIEGFEISQLGGKLEIPELELPPNIAKGMVSERSNIQRGLERELDEIN